MNKNSHKYFLSIAQKSAMETVFEDFEAEL